MAKVSVEEYLKYDASIDGKAEYYDGVVLEKVVVPPQHCLIAANICAVIGNQLHEGRYHAFTGGLRFFSPNQNAFVYPDFSVVDGDLHYAPMDRNTLQNPVVVVEVVSPESETLDRIRKFDCYWTMPSLREYVLIEQGLPQVDVILRVGEGKWLTTRYTRADEQVELKSLGIEAPMRLIYRGIDFESQDDLTTAP